MDQNIEESLSLETAMGVDFDHSEDVVIQADIGLQESTSQEIPMDYENTDEQSMLMDTETEEIIVSDFMGDSLTLPEYTLSNEHSSDMATLDPTNTSLSSPSDTIVDLQYNQQATLTAIKSEAKPRVVTVKTVTSLPSTVKKSESGVLKTVPRQVAIAPKPPGNDPFASKQKDLHKMKGHVAIAPKPIVTSKPVTLGTNKSAVGGTLKKVSIAGVTQATSKGNTVLAQIGKQLIMVPSGGQKIKLVSSSGFGNVQYVTGDSGQAQLISTKDGQKPMLQKLITVQGQQDNQPVVITKLMPKTMDKLPQGRYVTVQQKTAPSQLTQQLGSKVLVKSPLKGAPAGNKKHEIIAIHAPPPLALTMPGSSGVPENKVLIPANPKKVVVKPVTSQNVAQMTKKANVSDGLAHTQLQPINIPGKGVQYIRLITKPGSNTAKPIAVKHQTAAAPKTFVLTDNKGNLIHMTSDKMTGQQPSLIIANNASPQVATMPQQKLVRIAPVPPKTSQATTQPRQAQSLLAPMTVEVPQAKQEVTVEDEEIAEYEVEIESKESLQRMIEAATVDIENNVTMSTEQDSSGDAKGERSEHSEDLEQDLIVIPSFDHAEYTQNKAQQDESLGDLLTVNVECERDSPPSYSPPPQLPDDLILRPRKACNCTKSQCLKLYCDCFANGEFCNRCNCNNCHNNLENEELRQKAIRSCLDRNPHAFRPKIGKTKSLGPDIVRRHNKGCNCKRSGCLKNYCECYEAKIACSSTCKCVGCRNVEDSLEGRFTPRRIAPKPQPPALRQALDKQPCTFMTEEVIDAVCQCLIAVAAPPAPPASPTPPGDPVLDVIDEFARCLRDVIAAAQHAPVAPEGAA
ncbi:protein lin-54 homolog isoform X3 [Aricia agestis]|uniref:protein lin-54 homolog isoform X3 n=1 Tax=Aricia agestis TaxID=91739 RepID=UPI001C207802|nr:protein lin-54 homolog isoform X3 [Aricia agestis]